MTELLRETTCVQTPLLSIPRDISSVSTYYLADTM